VPPTISPIAQKLLFKRGFRSAVVNAPEGYMEQLRPLPEGVSVTEKLGSNHDLVQIFARDAAELEKLGSSAIGAVRDTGLLWVCYPKGGEKAGTDLNRDILWNLMGKMGRVGVSMVAIDDTWSAMRFRPEAQVKPGNPT
jgi:hypothetical protein